MKKIVTLLLSLCVLLCLGISLTACGDKDPDSGGVIGGGENCQHNLTYFAAVEGGCYTEGRIAYYHCGKCGERFTDESAQNRITSDEQLSTGFYHANSTHYEAKTATCSQIGNIEYTYCPTCSRYLDTDNNSIDKYATPLHTIEAHNFVNGVCTECESLTPSTGLAINNLGMICGIGDCQDKDIIIPNSYEKDGKIFPVIGIDNYAFDGANDGVDINSVRITKGVKSIGVNAFYNLSNLQTVIIEGKIEFNRNSFYSCNNVETIKLGEGITELVAADAPNEPVFSNCSSNLQNLYLPSTYNSSSLGGIPAWSVNNFNTYCGGKYLGNETNPYVYLAGAVNSETEVTEIHTDCKIIGDEAFDCYHIGEYRVSGEIPTSVKIIGDRAFKGANIITNQGGLINISESVEYIGASAFGGCFNAYIVDENNAKYKSDNYSLLTKDGKKLIAASPFDANENEIYNVPHGVEEIDAYTFYGMGFLKGVNFPSSLTAIGSNAFEFCNLVTVTIPASVEYIGERAFGITPIIYVEKTENECEEFASNWAYDENQGYVYNKKIIYNCTNNDIAEDGNVYVITDNYIFTLAEQKACVYSLGAVMPEGDNLTLPQSVEYKNETYAVTSIIGKVIGEFECVSLIIPDSYEEILDYEDRYGMWFISNENIKELTIGTNIKKIPNFNLSLTRFNYNGTLDKWMSMEFQNNAGSLLRDETKFYIRNGNDYAELTSVVLPDGCTYNGQLGFCDSITELVVPYGAIFDSFGSDNRRSLSYNATIRFGYFEDEISSEAKSKIPTRMTVVYEYGAENGSDGTFDYISLGNRVKITAYKGNSKIVTIPQKIAEKDVVDFGTILNGNTTIEKLIILARVNEIKTGAFANCTNLSWVYINGYVDNIKSGAFTNLNIATTYGSTESKEYLTTGIYFGTNEQTKESGWVDMAYPVHYSISFDPDSAIAYVVEGSDKTIIRYVGNMNTLSMPSSIGFTSIRAYAFSDCSLNEVILSNGIIEIGRNAFENSNSLTKITIPVSVSMIGAEAFKNSSLTNVKFEDAQNWYLVEYATQTVAALDNSVFASEETLATYLKNNLIDGYVLMKNVATA